MTTPTDAARESARQLDGKFGTQVHDEAEVDLMFAESRPYIQSEASHLLVVTNDEGLEFAVTHLPAGARYGRTGALVADRPLIEFYDRRFDFDGHGGQFVSRYYLDTLQGRDGYGERVDGQGLILDGGVPSWRIDGKTMDRIRAWFDDVEAARAAAYTEGDITDRAR